jgi:predicted Ser/Thr protein kinase
VELMIEADGEEHPLLDQFLAVSESSETVLQPGAQVGGYRIVREIGSGGMGSVYEAEAGGETVAIKVVRWHSHDFSMRFRQEQAILSGLRHPNIARLLDSGTTERQSPYFVMEYVEGSPIHIYCRRAGLSIDARIRLFRQVCRAVVYLHQNLVVHRDLKPGNVLVTAAENVKLVDFGIAKLLQTSQGLASPVKTIAGLMTPDYASPEQIRGGATSTLTDVYSLGILLYELLTGRRPFTAPSGQMHEILRSICEDEPLKPSAAGTKGAGAGTLRGELDNIILKAIRKEPDRRYVSVEQFDEDLRRYLDRQPVLAQGDSVGYRARKFAVRHKQGVAAAAVMVLLLSGGVVATSIEAGIAQRERARAEEQAQAAETARAQAEKQRRAAEQQRAEANSQRIRAESKAAEADRERAKAERRLEELQKVAAGAVHAYQSESAAGSDSSALEIAKSAHAALTLLDRERKLEPGMAEILDRTAATVQSHALAVDPSWQVPAGWTARETREHEYRVGMDHRIVHGGKSSLFLRSLVAHPTGRITVFQNFLPTRYRGRRVRLTAFLRSEAASPGGILGIHSGNLAARCDVSGTTGWKKYELVMDVPTQSDGTGIALTLEGPGTVWADDFQFEPVDSSVPVSIRKPVNLDFTK